MNEIELKEKIKLLREQNRDLKAKNAGLLELYRETNDLYEDEKKENEQLGKEIENLRCRISMLKGEQS